MLIYSHPKCTTCKKALKWLELHNISFEVKDIREVHPTSEELQVLVERSGLPLTKVFNTSGELYRKLGLKDVIKTMETSKAMELLASDGMLIKRPLLVSGDAVFFGFKEEQYEQLLKGESND